ncbi:M48 family metalloprotease [Erythrobacter sp. NFXS35]|uniref:M48 family metallopeptidase n=1 Tax=Erythrobacter sp. NFXS35 TaxID=2818436 RepID=UPI0032DFDDC8
MLSLLLVTLVLTSANTSANTSAGAAEAPDLALRGIAVLDREVETLGHRLAVRNAEICDQKAYHPGFSLHHLSQYSEKYRQTASAIFGLALEPRVLATARGGPAEAAGLKPGDAVLAVDGRAFSTADFGADKTAAVLATIHAKLDEAFADGRAEVRVERDGRNLSFYIDAEPGCATRFYLEPSSTPNAWSDGSNVVVTSSVAAFADDDSELAAVLAHELAHSVLGHKARLDEAGRSRSNVRESELEADRLSIHLLRQAGFDPQGAIRFWKRLGPKRFRLFSGSDHPPWRQRVEAIKTEITNLEAGERFRKRGPN